MKLPHRHLIATTAAALAFSLTSILFAAESSVEEFLRHEAAANGAAVRVAELGKKRAVRAEVKAFAEVLAADHTKAGTEIADLAKKKGVNLDELPSDDDHKELADTEKDEFDKDFLAVVIDHHEACIGKLEEASTESEDADLKAWAAKMLPGLKTHHEKAKALQGGAKTASNRAGSASVEADNAKKNMRDRDGKTLTPLDQGNSQADIDTTARIRKEIVARDGLSVNAQNATISTNEGRVTLRGPVASAEEKRVLGEIATKAAPGGAVDNQLEVTTNEPKN